MRYTRKEIIGDATLYHGDCLNLIPAIEADALVTDPPYGIGAAKTGMLGSNGIAPVGKYKPSEWDNKTQDQAINWSINQTKHQVIFGGNYYDLPPTTCWLIWDKCNSGGYADCEIAWTNLDKAIRKIEWAWNGFIRKGEMAKTGIYAKRVHPTEKPVGVMKWCIEHLPSAAETIFDPFMGSGTTGVACAKLGRKFIGIEIDENYFNIACKRIEEAYRQPDMFVEQPKKSEQMELIK